jgi:hypothetical protein
MTQQEYLEALFLGKGKKVKELVGANLLVDQVAAICLASSMSFEEVLDLSEIQFEVILNRIHQ